MQNYAFNYILHREPGRAIFEIGRNVVMNRFSELKNVICVN